jgi:hypothetical protein
MLIKKAKEQTFDKTVYKILTVHPLYQPTNWRWISHTTNSKETRGSTNKKNEIEQKIKIKKKKKLVWC